MNRIFRIIFATSLLFCSTKILTMDRNAAGYQHQQPQPFPPAPVYPSLVPSAFNLNITSNDAATEKLGAQFGATLGKTITENPVLIKGQIEATGLNPQINIGEPTLKFLEKLNDNFRFFAEKLFALPVSKRGAGLICLSVGLNIIIKALDKENKFHGAVGSSLAAIGLYLLLN